LFAKCRRLKRDAQRRRLAVAEAPMEAANARGMAGMFLRSKLNSSLSAEARAELALRLLAEHSGATDGVLYRVTPDGPVCVAACGTLEPSDELDASVRGYIASEVRGHDVTTGSDLESHQRHQWSRLGEASFRPVLLSHHTQAGHEITGLAVFAVAADQPFAYPAEIAAELSRLAMQASDAH